MLIDKKREKVTLLKSSGLFNEEYYLDQYPDVAKMGMDPVEHYIWLGARLGRDPSPTFSSVSYLQANEDVADANENPLFHYVKWGIKEGRETQPKQWIGKRWTAEPGTTYISSGPYTVRRSYQDFDFERQERFLRVIDQRHQADAESIDSVSVSIVMPTYNRGDKIEQAIQSILQQSHATWRLLIVDDGSEDDTSDVVRPYLEDDRIEFIEVDHLGVSAARNTGVLNSSGQYLAYLDSDNTWTRNYLRSMITFMETEGLEAAYSGIHALDDQGGSVCYRGDPFVWSACLKANYIDLNPFMHRRELIFRGEEPELFDTDLKRFVDWDLILRLTQNARVAYAPFVGVRYFDGKSGSRITLTEYQDKEADKRIGAIRAKHSDPGPDAGQIDTGAGLAMSRPAPGATPVDRYSLRFFPDYTVNNAYQDLLYSPMETFDVAPGSIDDCIMLIMRPVYENVPVVFHLHWTNPIFAPGEDASAAANLVKLFLEKLRFFKALGGQIVWTIHNVISHEPKYLEQEIELHQALGDLTDWIHVHHETVAETAAPHYDLPAEKLIVAEHGNYIGTIPFVTTREKARRKLGLPDDATVLLFLGQIRGYKGIDELIDAFELIRRTRDDVWLVMAGKVLGISQDEIGTRLAACRQTIYRPGYVPDSEMQDYLASADAMVLPYRKVLTSGSVFLALSFGLPVICPKAGLLSHLVTDKEEGLVYDPEDPDGLAQSMSEFCASSNSQRALMSEMALATAEAHCWETSAQILQRHIEAGGFGAVCQPEIGGRTRRWFVRGDHDALKDCRCLAIVLHYQNLNDTRDCIDGLKEQGDDVGIVVISNNESVEDARAIAEDYPDLLVVQSEDNVGYAAANNFGLWLSRKIQSEFFWIINPDIVAPDDFFRVISERVKDYPEHSFFGTTIVAAHEPTKVLFCGGEIDFDRGGVPSHIHMDETPDQLPKAPFECDYLTGANIFGRTAALEIAGYLPEDYFLYFEETAWFVEMERSSELGSPIIIPELIVQNRKRSETGLIPSRYYIYYFVRNSIIFGQRFTPDRTSLSEEEAQIFAKAWLSKIETAAPEKVKGFEELVERAISDGRNGVTGKAVL